MSAINPLNAARGRGYIDRWRKAWPDLSDWIAYVAAWPVISIALRKRLLARRGHAFAAATRIRPATIVLGSRLSVGHGTFINRDCRIEAVDQVQIGAEVHVAPGVRLITLSHEIGPPDHRAGERFTKPIVIGDGAWIGAGATILPGVTVGCGAVVAAGAVVSSDVAPDTLVGGVPARQLRALDTAAG